MNKPHKHAELIKAWADGAEIERKVFKPHISTPTWIPSPKPNWDEFEVYRIKPNTIKYRNYLWLDSFGSYGVYACTEEQNQSYDYEYMKNFVKWLGDWQEVEV